MILTLKGLNTDSGTQHMLLQTCARYSFEFNILGNEAVPAKFNGIEQFKTDETLLFPEIVELRVIKTPEELAVMRYVNKVSRQGLKKK